MDQKMLKQLEELQKAVAKISATMLTKNDAKNFATKDDLKNLVSKSDLKRELARYPTKNDLRNGLAKYATKDDLRSELNKQREAISDDIGEVIRDIADELDQKKADTTRVNLLESRVKVIERKVAA